MFSAHSSPAAVATMKTLLTKLVPATVFAVTAVLFSARPVYSVTTTLNLIDASIHSLIETVSSHTDKNFIVDPRVNATVTVVSSQAVDARQLYELFLSVLDIHGFAAVDTGNFIKIVPATVGVHSAVPVVPVINSEPDSGDTLVTEVVNVQGVPAGQMVEALRGLLPETASISVEAHSNTIIITDRAANIARLSEVIRLLENPQ